MVEDRVSGRLEGVRCAWDANDATAVGLLFARYCDDVRGFLARASGTDARDLDDLVQSTFEAVPRAARGFDGRSSVRTWLLGIANNIVRRHVRTEIRRRRLVAAVAECLPIGTTADLADDHDRSRRLHTAIDALPPRLRDPFLLVYREGLSGAAASKIVGTREGTIWKRLHEARAVLRTALVSMG